VSERPKNDPFGTKNRVQMALVIPEHNNCPNQVSLLPQLKQNNSSSLVWHRRDLIRPMTASFCCTAYNFFVHFLPHFGYGKGFKSNLRLGLDVSKA